VIVDLMSPSMRTMSPEPEALEPATDHDGRAGMQAMECRAAGPMVGP
jgi:hypothetical protein